MRRPRSRLPKAGVCLLALLVLAGAVVKAVFYRCPHCGEFLPVKGKTPDTCPHCGESLK